jgi:hypothetical protein
MREIIDKLARDGGTRVNEPAGAPVGAETVETVYKAVKDRTELRLFTMRCVLKIMGARHLWALQRLGIATHYPDVNGLMESAMRILEWDGSPAKLGKWLGLFNQDLMAMETGAAPERVGADEEEAGG